jgi:selenocysteine lyase/cysteine desulfurase
VVDAVTKALELWRSGERHWSAWWEETCQECRSLIAAYLRVPDRCAALIGSFAEAAATVTACLPPGRGGVPQQPVPTACLDGGAHQVVCMHSRHGGVRTTDLIAAITPGTVLVTFSEVLSCHGVRADLPALRQAADEVGARVFINATQSLGALRLDFASLRPDHLPVHGDEWMLCPRGPPGLPPVSTAPASCGHCCQTRSQPLIAPGSAAHSAAAPYSHIGRVPGGPDEL